MSPRAAAAAICLAAASLGGCSDGERPAGGAGDGERCPRLLLVTIDTLRADHLPWHGYPRPTSPALAALAERSLAFETAVSAASHTAPSHASMLSGLYPGQHGVLENGMSFADDAATLAALLGAAGYRTGAFSSVSFLGGLSRGFDVFDAPAPIDEEAARAGAEFERYRPATRTVDAALAWLEAGEGPAFAWVHLFDVHEWMRDEPVPEDLAAVGAPADDAHFRHLVATNAINPSMPPDERAAHLDAVDRYDAKILAVDREVARLIDRATAGAAARTVSVVTSDHGEGLGAHGYEGHGRELYEEQIAVPLLVHASDGSLVGRIPELVRTIDVFPTLLELAGADAPPLPGCADPALEARSLLPYAGAGRRDEPGRLAFAQRRPGYPGGMLVTVRSRRHKFILRPERKDAFYDLQADPRELHGHVGRGGDAFERLRDVAVRQVALQEAQAEGRPVREVDPRFAAELEQLGYTK